MSWVSKDKYDETKQRGAFQIWGGGGNSSLYTPTSLSETLKTVFYFKKIYVCNV